MTLRVGCNLLWIVPGVVGGSEEYTVGLLRALADRGTGDDLEVVLFANRAVAAAHPELLARYEHVVAPLPGANRVRRVATESTWLARAARQARLDLLHHPGGTMPAVRTCPGVVTIHDLQPWALPQGFSRVKRAYLHAAVPRAARRARGVITTSAWVRDDVVARLGVEPDRARIVPPAVLAPVEPTTAEVDRVLAGLDLRDRPFLLYPAITYAHKDHRTLLRAFSRVVAQRSDAVLVLAGGEGPAEGDVRDLVSSLGLGQQVRRPGRLPAADLDVLYRRARALTFASRYEGFGLPVLEAMSRGCPVVATRATALEEVAGDAGVLVEPGDVAGWAEAMLGLLDDPADRRRALVAAARARAATFTWERSAAALAAAYRGAASPGPAASPEPAAGHDPAPEVPPR